MKRKFLVFVFMCLAFFISNATATEAATRVMWGKTELKLGQIGKVTITKDTNLVRLEGNGNLTTVKKLKKGEEFRVYQYKGQNGGLYGVGASSFIQKSDTKVKYETPSKYKLGEIKRENTNFFNVFNVYQPVKYGMDSKELLGYLNKNVFKGNNPDEYYFDVNGSRGYNYIRASTDTIDFNNQFSNKVKFTGDEKIGFNFVPYIKYWENRKNQVFSLDFSLYKGNAVRGYDQKKVFETMVEKISKEIGNPTRKYIRSGKFYEALWENSEEQAFFSTGIGGNGNPFLSFDIINKKLMDPKFNEYRKTDKTVDIK